jgi:hypothetical protein
MTQSPRISPPRLRRVNMRGDVVAHLNISDARFRLARFLNQADPLESSLPRNPSMGGAWGCEEEATTRQLSRCSASYLVVVRALLLSTR